MKILSRWHSISVYYVEFKSAPKFSEWPITLEACRNVPNMDQNWPDAGPVLARHDTIRG